MVNTISGRLKKSLIIIAAVVQVFSYSLAGITKTALADHLPEHACPAVTGTTSPTGASASTFSFNQQTCIWENIYYTWSPITKSYTAKYDQTPKYNSVEDTWEHIVWDFNPAKGVYESRTVSTPANSSTNTASSPGSSTPTVMNTSLTPGGGTLAQSTGTSTISNTGTASNNSIDNNNNTIVNADITRNASILQTLDSNAGSGDSTAIGNTTVGNINTGEAQAIANLLNMIQSSWNPTNERISTFSANLYENYFGDLLFDPSRITNTGTSSNNDINGNNNTDLTINIEENANITNNIALNANSGNSTANGNTTVGDVSTGDATAIANVINMINSMIVAGQSFLGSVNLYGDLQGDILLPAGLLAQLINTRTGSNNLIANSNDTNIDASKNQASRITNNTNLTSTSGNAQADGNTTVGNVSTGNAETSVNEMNLIGQNITGNKGLLVFVNVLGSWIGMIFGSPTNTAILGTGTNSNNTIASNSTTNADINVNKNYDIVNNLTLNATSGDATANGNTSVGDVSTGNATTSVNLLNMIDSYMNFTDWFGVLFINVFGSWNGSFGVNTAAGNRPGENKGAGAEGTAPQPAVAGTSSSQEPPKVFDFVPRAGTIRNRVAASLSGAAASTNSQEASSLQSKIETTDKDNSPAVEEAVSEATKKGSFWLPIAFGLAAVVLLFGERIIALVRRPGA